MPSTLAQKAFFGSVHQYVAAFVTLIFGALTSVYVIRQLTVAEFGIYHFLISIILLASIATSLGLPQTIQRYLPEYRERNNAYLQKRTLSGSMLVRLVAGFIFISVVLLADQWIMNIFNLPEFSRNLFPFVALITLIILESQLVGDSALVALFENKYWNYSTAGYSAVKFSLFVLALLLGYGITGIVWSWLIAEILLFSLFFARAYRVLFSLPHRSEDIQPLPLKRYFNFGKYLYLHQASYFFRDKAIDIFILSYFLGPYAVGLYSVAFGIPLMLASFSPGSRLRAVSVPFLVQKYAKTSDTRELSYFFQLMNRVSFFVMVPAFIVLMLLADEVMLYILKPEYLQITPLFVLSLGFLLIQQFTYAYTAILLTLEKTRIIFFASMMAIYNLIMDLILIPHLGILGAIIATGSAGAFLPFYYHFAMKREGTVSLKYPWRSFARFAINVAITAIMVFFLRGFIDNLLSLIAVLAISGLVYLTLSYLNKGFEEQDRNIINEAIGRKLFVF